MHLLAAEMKYAARGVECAFGIASVKHQLKLNTHDVVHELAQDRRSTMYVVSDILTLNRPDRATVLALLQQTECVSVVLCQQAWCCPQSVPHVEIHPPYTEEIECHLWWIVCEEGLSISDECVRTLAAMGDVNYAVNCLQTMSFFEKDSNEIDDYQFALRVHEKLAFKDISTTADFAEMMSVADTCHACHVMQTKAQLYNAIVHHHLTTSPYELDHHNAVSGNVNAKHAQMKNRLAQMRQVCEDACVLLDMNWQLAARIYKHYIRQESSTNGDAAWRTGVLPRALYLFAKQVCSISEARAIKKYLKV